jgi:hypothetical protein
VDRNYDFSTESPEHHYERFGDGVRIEKESVEFTGDKNVAYDIIEWIYLHQFELRQFVESQRQARIGGYIDDSSYVGIFWRVQVSGQPRLLIDRARLSKAEPYGEGAFLVHGAHALYWDKLASLGASGLHKQGLPDVVLWSEYDEWPRGRVEYHTEEDRFTVYGDRKLQTSAILEEIMERFSLPPARTLIQIDAHYVSAR